MWTKHFCKCSSILQHLKLDSWQKTVQCHGQATGRWYEWSSFQCRVSAKYHQCAFINTFCFPAYVKTFPPRVPCRCSLFIYIIFCFIFLTYEHNRYRIFKILPRSKCRETWYLHKSFVDPQVTKVCNWIAHKELIVLLDREAAQSINCLCYRSCALEPFCHLWTRLPPGIGCHAV